MSSLGVHIEMGRESSLSQLEELSHKVVKLCVEHCGSELTQRQLKHAAAYFTPRTITNTFVINKISVSKVFIFFAAKVYVLFNKGVL